MTKCSAENCSKRATFAYHKDDELQYCKAHSVEGMLDVKNKRCSHIGCEKIKPVFAYHKSDEFKYGKNHAVGDMIDVRSKKCSYMGCNSQPVFAYHKSDEFKYCKSHKAEDMRDVRSKKCSHVGCDSIPNFSYSKNDVLRYCKTHAADDMVDVKHRKCAHSTCDSVNPSFAYTKNDEFKYCKTHAAEDMIDVNHRRCTHLGCNSLNSVFAYTKNDEFKYCKTHAIEGMVDVLSKRCAHPDCDHRPVFAYYKSDKFKYCKTHASKRMQDVKSKKCMSCGLFQVRKSKDYLCSQCFVFTYPDHILSCHYKTKELTFTKLLQQDLSEQGIPCVLDSKISGGCSRRRPDVFIDLLSHVLIIEIDENQHLSYNESCEYVRTIELNEDIGHRPMYIIRLNPDSYKFNGKSIRGCFTSKMELNKKEFEHRYSILFSAVLDLTATPPERLIESIELFFTESD